MQHSLVTPAAKRARKTWGITKRAEFGDCSAVCRLLVEILQELGIQCRLQFGKFHTAEDEEWDHTWVETFEKYDIWILDPTVDQFYSSLDIDLETKTDGIYYSKVDGDELASRYEWNNK